MRTVCQVVIGLLIAIALSFAVASFANFSDGGTFGLTLGYAAGAQRIASVTPGSPAAKLGLRPGTPVYLAGGLAARDIEYSPRPGERLSLRVGGPNGPLVTLVAVLAPSSPIVLIAIVTLTRLAFLLIAGIVAWRRGDDPGARALAVFLAAFGTALSVDFDVVFDPAWRFLAFVLMETLFVLGAASVLAFACSFPAPTHGSIRERLARTVPAFVGIGFALAWVRLFGVFAFGAYALVRPLVVAYTMWYALVLLLALAAFVGSIRTASGPDRVRMWWVLATFGVGFSGLIVMLVAYSFGVSSQWVQYCAFTILLIPLGLGYTILRHRVLDIGFVVNRAVVYSGVSFAVVGSFIAFEWLLGFIVERGSNTSIALQLGGALVLGLSVRFIHARVDRYVDDVFFRERHAAEAAVRRFAREAALISTTEDLVRKTVEIAQSRMRLTGCAFYERENDSYVPLYSTITGTEAVSENDYAVLEMRAWHAAVGPRDRPWDLRGELAFPMTVRGELLGFLLCGEKATREIFAPDERDALGVLARDAGIALDSLRVRLVERELALLASDGELPAAVRARLRTLRQSRTLAAPQ